MRYTTLHTPIHTNTGMPEPKQAFYTNFGKRFFDIVFACMALIVLFPIMVFTAIGCAIAFNGHIFFTQTRTGKHAQPFRVYKFISMKPADAELPKSDTERLTRFGNWLRKYSLDELPQLLNILKGDMSVIGPRPLLPRYIPYYSCPEMARHDVKPGLTGLAQIKGRNTLDWETRLYYDCQYVTQFSFKQDLHIFFRTLRIVGAAADHHADPRTILQDLDLARSPHFLMLKPGIRMRPLAISDAEGLLQVKNNKEAALLLENDPPEFTHETIQTWIAYHLQKKENSIYILEDINQRLIFGHCGLYDIDIAAGSCIFGILIGLPAYWHKGIGLAATFATIAEAKKIKGMQHLQLHVLQENTRAIHIYEKAGFKTSRILTGHTLKNGVAKDTVHMTLELY